MVERPEQKEKTSSKKDEEVEKSILHRLAELPFKVIKEIIDKLKKKEERGGKLSGDEPEILEAFEKTRVKRREEFFKTKYGKKAQDRLGKARRETGEAIDRVLQGLTAASEEELSAKIKDVQEEITKQRKSAREKWEKEDANIKNDKFKGIAEDDLTSLLEEKSQEFLQSVLKKKAVQAEPGPTQRSPKTREERQKLAQTAREHQAEAERLWLKNRNDPKAANELTKANTLLRQYAGSEQMSAYDLEPKQRELLMEGLKTGDETKVDMVFQDIFSSFGVDKGRQFRDADMISQSQWSKFTQILRKENPELLEHYILRFGFEEITHNFDYFLRGQATIPDINKVVNQFQSNMLDVAARQPGAVAAFRAYEQAYRRLALLEGKFTPELAAHDPDSRRTWIDLWARKQVRETLTAQICQKEKASWEEAENIYAREYKPYETSFLRTGQKILSFTLRADEIQSELPLTRSLELGAPKREDLARVLDPMLLPLRYWEKFRGVDDILGREAGTAATALYFFHTGEKKKFKTIGEYLKSIDRLKKERRKKKEKGEVQHNLFEIGGILSTSHWRAVGAMEHIATKENPELARFMGIEMEYKIFHDPKDKTKDEKFKKQAFEHGLIRNPFGVFLSADQEDQDAILREMGVNLTDLNEIDKDKEKERYKRSKKDNERAKKDFFGEFNIDDESSLYDNLSQALQRLVYRQQEEMRGLLFDEKGNLRDREDPGVKVEISAFLDKEKNIGLNFDFVGDVEQKKELENFVSEIRKHFKKGNQNFERLVKKDFPFSIGTEDTPMELFRFVQLGDIVLQRRFRDVHTAASATQAFWKLISNLGPILQSEDKMLESLLEIKTHMVGYGFENSDKQMEKLCIRIIDLLGEDKLQKLLPWPANKVRDGMGGKMGLTSKAEKLYGQYHMSLNKDELRLLVEKMIGVGLFSGEYAHEARQKFYKKFKLAKPWVWLELGARYMPFLIPAGITIAAALILVSQIKKEVEETAKEV